MYFIFVVHMAPWKTTQTRAQLDIEEGLERKREKQREYSAKSRANKKAISSSKCPTKCTTYVRVTKISNQSIQQVMKTIYEEYFTKLYVDLQAQFLEGLVMHS